MILHFLDETIDNNLECNENVSKVLYYNTLCTLRMSMMSNLKTLKFINILLINLFSHTKVLSQVVWSYLTTECNLKKQALRIIMNWSWR